VILTLTPHIVRVLDLTEGDLRPFRLQRDSGATLGDTMGGGSPPRDDLELQSPAVPPGPPSIPPLAPAAATPAAPATSPVSAQPPFPQPLQGPMPGTPLPITPPAAPKKPGGGGS